MKLLKPTRVKARIVTIGQKEQYKLNVVKELVKLNITFESAKEYVNTFFPILIKEWEEKHKKYPKTKDFARVLINFHQWSDKMYKATAWQMEE